MKLKRPPLFHLKRLSGVALRGDFRALVLAVTEQLGFDVTPLSGGAPRDEQGYILTYASTIPGDPGDQGGQGQRGSSGQNGANTFGPKGDDGEKGLPGDQPAEKGEKGDKGDKGDKGLVGDPGGEPGEDGDVGNAGTPGIFTPGPKGPPSDDPSYNYAFYSIPGDKGEKGPKGPDGIKLAIVPSGGQFIGMAMHEQPVFTLRSTLRCILPAHAGSVIARVDPLWLECVEPSVSPRILAAHLTGEAAAASLHDDTVVIHAVPSAQSRTVTVTLCAPVRGHHRNRFLPATDAQRHANDHFWNQAITP